MTATMLKVDKETGEESRVEVTVDKDECNRPNTTLEGLAGLAPAFDDDGTVTGVTMVRGGGDRIPWSRE